MPSTRTCPFDQFTIEQIAGDMLPDATLDQKIASGFNRNHRGNGEGGIVPEEYSVEYVVDRVETTSTVWLGLTMGCARCHDHKYDPIKQKDFYRTFAYFNNVPERGRAFKFGNSAPFIPAPTRSQLQQLSQLEAKWAEAEKQFEALGSEIEKLERTWEASLAQSTILDWSFDQDLLLHYPLDGTLAGQPGGFKDGKPVQVRLLDGMPHFVPGRLGAAVSFDGKRFLEAGDVAELGFFDRFSLSRLGVSHGARRPHSGAEPGHAGGRRSWFQGLWTVSEGGQGSAESGGSLVGTTPFESRRRSRSN